MKKEMTPKKQEKRIKAWAIIDDRFLTYNLSGQFTTFRGISSARNWARENSKRWNNFDIVPCQIILTPNEV